MFREFFCFLLILKSSQASIEHDPGLNLVININSSGQNKTELIYSQQFEAPSRSINKFKIRGLNQKFLSHAVFQLHTFRMNVTLSLDADRETSHQNGTNLGFFLASGVNSRSLYMWNDNYDEVECLISVVLYNYSAPLVGGCSLEDPKIDPTLRLEETENFMILHTRPAQALDEGNRNKSCRPPNEYSTYFTYIEQLNFSSEVYFDGIKSLIFEGAFENGYEAKRVHSPFTRYFEKVPGTGLIINSVIVDEESGQAAFYIPIVTYSCPPNTWSIHCSDTDLLKKALSVCLVLYSVVMIMHLTMINIIESCLNGMLVGSSLTFLLIRSYDLEMSNFGIFMTTIFAGVILAAITGTIALHFRIGRFLTKFVFCNLLMAMVMESYFEETTSIYVQVGCAFAMSLSFGIIDISFSVFQGGLLLIMGISHLLKAGNIHRILVNNIHALTMLYSDESFQEDSLWTFQRYNFINYRIKLSVFDSTLLMFYVIGSVVLTIRKEMYFYENPEADDGFNHSNNTEEYNRVNAKKRRDKCIIGFQTQQRLNLVSRCRRHHYRSNVIHERSPLISHWVASDDSEVDEVFVSPTTNSHFIRTLSSDSRERLEAIQNFNN